MTMTETLVSLSAADTRELGLIVALRQHCLTRLFALKGPPPEGFDEVYFLALLYGLSGNENKSDQAAGDLTNHHSGGVYIRTADTCAALAPHFPAECYVVNDTIVEGAIRWLDRGVDMVDAVKAWQALVSPAFIEGKVPAAMSRKRRPIAETPWQPKPSPADHVAGCMCRRCGGQKAPRPAVDLAAVLERRLKDAVELVGHGRFGPYHGQS
jgi:hypothetical protein